MLFTPVDGKMNKENDDGPLDAQTKPYSKDMNHPKHIAIPGSSSMKKHMSLFHQGFVWWVFFSGEVSNTKDINRSYLRLMTIHPDAGMVA